MPYETCLEFWDFKSALKNNQFPTAKKFIFFTYTLLSLIVAQGVLAMSDLIRWQKCWGFELSNGGLGLKIGQLLRILRQFGHFCQFWPSPNYRGAFIRGRDHYGQYGMQIRLQYGRFTYHMCRTSHRPNGPNHVRLPSVAEVLCKKASCIPPLPV